MSVGGSTALSTSHVWDELFKSSLGTALQTQCPLLWFLRIPLTLPNFPILLQMLYHSFPSSTELVSNTAPSTQEEASVAFPAFQQVEERGREWLHPKIKEA